ncbi:NAD(P)-dependent oxidoreductase [bacterium]|nr:NAD(P)-dependent oxidoreductase [bacterium]
MHSEKIGWIGTGVMGSAMAGHMLKAGHSLSVFTRTRAKAEPLIAKGAAWCENPKSVAEASHVVFTMVGYPDDVEQIVLGENGILSAAKSGTVLVDMTTSKPSLAEKIFQEAEKKGVQALDAPVSGGDVGAREAKLAIMVGGTQETFNKILPLFKLMGETIAFMGGPGKGQHTKMCNQILIASTMIGTVESLLYAARSGLGPEAVIDIIGKGAAGSWAINTLGRRITASNYEPGFFIKHFVKDMGIAIEESKQLGLSLPGLALANKLYVAAMAMGYENLGTQALYLLLERMNERGPDTPVA